MNLVVLCHVPKLQKYQLRKNEMFNNETTVVEKPNENEIFKC